ncbi:MAG: hypothetical protein MUC36_18865 [Planctomycetes bacterium]|jgi:hypothetical protein|nr:hypothetical protein [Planctomycetota bacterium]
MNPPLARPIAHRLPWRHAVLALAALAAAVRAQQSPFGFAETYALATDRKAAVATLVPGSEDHFYYHCRERLDAGDFATVAVTLPRWIAAHGRSTRTTEIEHRDRLLRAAADPAATFAWLQQRLELTFDHQPEVPGRPSTLPTRLDPALLTPAAVRAAGLRSKPGSLAGFTDAALPELAGGELDAVPRRELLKRLDRADLDPIPALVIADLQAPGSKGFGSLRVHGLLQPAQLDECAQLMPELLRDAKWVQAYLQRLLPPSDRRWQNDPAQLGAQLERLGRFVERLPDVHRALRAHVLGHRVRHALTTGNLQRELLVAYLREPVRDRTREAQWIESFPSHTDRIDAELAKLTGLERVTDDSELLRACLAELLARNEDLTALEPFLDANWLRATTAELRLLLGRGDAERNFSELGSEDAAAALRTRVELRFAPQQRQTFGGDDEVTLLVDVKNVADLTIRVFTLDEFRHLQEHGRPIDLSLDVDGFAPAVELQQRFDEPPLRRVRRTFSLPQLREPGLHLVELIGNGVRSRALIRKGTLHAVVRSTAAGPEFTVFDETGQLRADAVVWLGASEYTAAADGTILLPFTAKAAMANAVLRAGGRAALHSFRQPAEDYRLQAAAHVDRDQLRAGGTARLVLRPRLVLDDHTIALQLLQQPTLVITATDLDQQQTIATVRDLRLVDQREFVHELQVPVRLRKLEVRLQGTARRLDGTEVQVQSETTEFACNGIDSGTKTASAMVLPTADGYVVEVRGKNGEPRPGAAVTVQLEHELLAEAIESNLQTDAGGRIALGSLPGVHSLWLRIDEQRGSRHWLWLPRARHLWPADLHGIAGDLLQLPYDGTAATVQRAEFSLLAPDRDEFARLAIVDGMLTLRDLPAGDYELVDHRTARRVTVRVAASARRGPWLVEADRTLPAGTTASLQLRAPQLVDGALQIRVDRATADTRLLVIATRHLPTFDPFEQLRLPPEPRETAVRRTPHQSLFADATRLGIEQRYVLERRAATKFAGNMLPRPSLLLHGMEIDTAHTEDFDSNQWNSAVGVAGGTGRRSGGGKSGWSTSLTPPGVSANLDWLPQGSVVLTNLIPDADGRVRIPEAELGDGHFVQVVAIDGEQLATRQLLRAEQPLQPRPRQLAAALDANRPSAERSDIEFLAAGASTTIADARASEVAILDSLASMFRLFTSIGKDAELAKFAFLLQWPQLDFAKRRELYSAHACHELHLFLFHKDPQFFAAVIAPLLRNKLAPTFLDRWLLGDDLRDQLEPWAFGQLNLIEQVLLGKRLGGDAGAAIARAQQEWHELQPVSRERRRQLFAIALRGDALATADDKSAGTVRRLGTVLSAGPAPTPEPAKPSGGGGDARHLAEPEAAAEPAVPPPPPETFDNADGDEKQSAFDSNQWNSAVGLGRDAERRKNAPVRYREVTTTRVLAEHDYWHRPLAQTTPDVVATNRFWIDYAMAPSGQPFVSTAIAEASNSCLEMLMALAVLDLPFTAGAHTVVADGDTRTLTAASPLLLVRKAIGPVERAVSPLPLLVERRLFRVDRSDDEATPPANPGELVVGIAYGASIVITNPTSSTRRVDVLQQIPAGALPLRSGLPTGSRTLELNPYSTIELRHWFYFPAAGDFDHAPVQVSERDRQIAASDSVRLRVVATPVTVDAQSWEQVSQQGTDEQVLAFLDTNNLQRLELRRIAWRLRDRGMFERVLGKLRQASCYDDTLWSYSILHQDPIACREYLRHAEQLKDACGMQLHSPLLSFTPEERGRYWHQELDPLVRARSHRFGAGDEVGNQDLAGQYRKLLTRLSYRRQLDADDWLAVTWSLLLQDRVEEALAAMAKVDPTASSTQLQYDYVAAYTCFFTGDTGRARTLAERHRDHPVPHWQQRFRQVLAQLDEITGAAPIDPLDAAVAATPSLELGVSDDAVTIDHRGLERCELSYHELDVEVAFSARPFAAPGGNSDAFVQPLLREQHTLGADTARTTLPLPARFRGRHVLVELRGEGMLRSQRHFANALAVRFQPASGQLDVRTAAGTAPIAGAYVKVFARLPDGSVRFHKDGYTDLRGRFDYVALPDDPNRDAQRFAVLVLSAEHGALVREIEPPAR